MSNVIHYSFVLLYPPKIDVALKTTIEFMIDHH
jgi:hypothetical protein